MADLDERAAQLDRMNKEGVGAAKGIGLRLDIIYNMINQINQDDELKQIFGDPVMDKLAIFSDGSDISIVDAGKTALDEGKKLRFLEKLSEIYEQNLRFEK